MDTHSNILKELESEYLKLKEEWPQLRISIHSKVVEWRWATSSMGVFEPFFIELTRTKAGGWLPALPDGGSSCTKVGLDSVNRVLIELFSGADAYYVYSEQQIISLEADTQGRLMSIRKAFLKDGKPQWYTMHSESGRQQFSVYHYSGDLITIIKAKYIYSSQIQEPTYTINYNGSGIIESIYRKDAVSSHFPQGQKVCVYQHNPYALEELAEILTNAIVDAVVFTVKSNFFAEPVWCLALILFEPFGRDGWFPPALAIGLQSEKPHVFLSLEEDLSLENIQSVFRLEEPRLEELSQLFEQECETNEYYGLPDEVLKQVAVKLRQQNLDIALTSDFVIIPCNTDASLLESLAEVYTPEEITSLL